VRVLRLLALAGVGALLLLSIFSVGAEARDATSLNGVPYVMVVRIISTDHYQVEVQNTNPQSFIKSFEWFPPGGLTVTAVTGSQGGTCKLDGLGGISCSGKALPSTCDGCVGSSMTVNFTAKGLEPTYANGFWTYYGVVGGVQVTGTIPIQKPTFSDLPTCAKGKKSTPSHLCTPG
jgi:hypothetical protein